MKNIAGIDPGLSGGVAVQLHSGMVAEPMPVTAKTKGEIDVNQLIRILKNNGVGVVYLEKLGVRPGQSVTSDSRAGVNWGMIYGALVAFGYKVEVVTPQAWKARILAGTAKDKTAAINYATRNYPEVNLVQPRCRKPHDGVADAICICRYGARVEAGK